MSFSIQTANPYLQNPNDAQRYSSWRESDPCPMGYGCNKTGLKWMTDQFNIQKPSANKYSNYLVSSIVGLIGICQLSRLGYIWINGKAVVPLNYNWNAQGYADTQIPTWQDGNPGFNSFVRVYRGLETQTSDSQLVSVTGQQHPNYKGAAYAILFNVNWGAGASSIQNVEIEWIAVPDALNGWTSGNNNLYGVNMIAAAAAMLSHRRGGAAMGSFIDPVTWGSQAQALEANGVGGRTGMLTWGHPVYTQIKDTQTVLADLAQYFDGYFPITGMKLGVSWRPGTAPSTTGLTVLSEQDHVEPPDLAAIGRDAMPSVVVVTYTEDGTYATRGAPCQVSRNIASTPGNQSTKKYDMPFLKGPTDGTSTNVPQIIAGRLGQDAGVLDANGTSKILRRSAVWASGTPLAPGDLFIINYAQFSLNRVVRVKSISDDATNEYVEIQWMRERGAFPTVFTPPADVRVIPTDVAPAAIANADIQPFLLPTGFGLTRQVVVLIQRPSFAYASCVIWYASASAGPFAQLGSQNYFAVRGTLTAGAGSGDSSIAMTTTGVDMPSMQSEAALPQADDTLLAIIPSTGEVLSVGTITVTTANNYTLSVLRGRQGSTAQAIANGANVWLVPRSQLVGWTNSEWMNIFTGGVYDATKATKYFEVQPASATKTGTAAPTGGIGYTLSTTVPAAVTGLTATAPGGAAISLTWNQSTSPYLDKYQVVRSTAGSGGPWTTIGYTKSNKFDDTGTVGGINIPQQYWYEVIALDIYGNPSTASNVATATTGGAPQDPTPPQAAGTISFNANGTISVAGDGTVNSSLILNIPALPLADATHLAALYQNVLYRVQGSAGWQIGAVCRNSTATTQQIDLLAPGVPYEFALQAFTKYDVGGAITNGSGLPYTAPNKGGGPANPTGFAAHVPSSTYPVPPTYAAPQYLNYASTVTFTPSTSSDVKRYEWGVSSSATSAPTSVAGLLPASSSQFYYYTSVLNPQYLWMRAVDRSEVAAAWVYTGLNMNGYVAIPAGTMSTQDQTSPKMTGVQIGGSSLSSSASTTNSDGWDTAVHVTTGGSTDESFTLSLPGGFSTKPRAVLVTLNSVPVRAVQFYYDYDDASNSSTSVVVHIQSLGGAFAANEPYRFGWKALA